MSWGNLTIGRLTLVEVHNISDQVNASTGERTVSLTGREFAYRYGPSDDLAAIARRQEDIMGLADQLVPVTLSNKTENNGYYQVHDVNAQITKWPGEQQFIDWSMILRKIGPDNTVDIESRLSTIVRANDFALSGERWHAPAIGYYAYYTGATTPSSRFLRATEAGDITVFRDVPTGVNPRWGSAVGTYLTGRVRILVASAERNGVGVGGITTTNWELNNGLVRVRPLASAGMIEVSAWGGTAWESKSWNIARGGATTALGTFQAVLVVRNDLEACTIRLVKHDSLSRALVDLTLRRGSRFVEVYIQNNTSTTLGLYLQTAETATSNIASGYVSATADDADGNRFIVGTSKTATYTTDLGLSKASTAVFDGYIGVIFGGAAAVAGDQAATIRNQYIGTLSESTAMVRR